MTFDTPPLHIQSSPHCLTTGFKGVFGFTWQASCDLYPEVWIQFGIRACVCLQHSLPDPRLRCFVTLGGITRSSACTIGFAMLVYQLMIK